jgi:hypothetical protein
MGSDNPSKQANAFGLKRCGQAMRRRGLESASKPPKATTLSSGHEVDRCLPRRRGLDDKSGSGTCSWRGGEDARDDRHPCRSRSGKYTTTLYLARQMSEDFHVARTQGSHDGPKIRTQGAEDARSRVRQNTAIEDSRRRRAHRTTESDTDPYPGSGPSW